MELDWHYPLLARLRHAGGLLAEKVRDLGLDRLGEQGTRPIAQDFGELIVELSWLNQLGDVIIEHGIAPSVEKWRRQAPPRYAAFPIPAVPTFGENSDLMTSHCQGPRRLGSLDL